MQFATVVNQDFFDFDSLFNYLPRAISIGFLSPFPSVMLKTGTETGRIGNIVAGIETVIFYVVFVGFLYMAFKARLQLAPITIAILFSIVVMDS